MRLTIILILFNLLTLNNSLSSELAKGLKKIDDYKSKTLTNLKNVKNELRFIDALKKKNNYSFTIFSILQVAFLVWILNLYLFL